MPEAPSAPTSKMLRYINTGTQITFVHEGKPYHILRSEPELFSKAAELIKSGYATSSKLLEIIDAPRFAMLELLRNHPDLSLDGEVLLFRGFPIHATLSKKLSYCLKDGFGAEPFLKFLENLTQNPRKEVLENLYEFLEYGQMALDDEGHFYAYKAVTADYKDIYTETYDNRIGQKLSMPAWAVDPDRNRTCSRGFHCCSFDYLPHFNHADGHVMVVRVNPRDVIAIPADYHNTKMRVCAYEVVDEYKDYYTEERRNVLAARAIISSEARFDDEPFELVIDFGRVDGEQLTLDYSYALQPTASEIAELIQETLANAEGADWLGYKLTNVDTGQVLLEVQNAEYAGESDGMGNLYYLLGHPRADKFDADDEEAILFGTFNAGNRACRALLQLVHGEEPSSCMSYAVFATPERSDAGLREASRILHSALLAN